MRMRARSLVAPASQTLLKKRWAQTKRTCISIVGAAALTIQLFRITPSTKTQAHTHQYKHKTQSRTQTQPQTHTHSHMTDSPATLAPSRRCCSAREEKEEEEEAEEEEKVGWEGGNRRNM
ncbi:unnamed protein product [Prorocentrum cordatum]|uniref:Uncharacterized protein n=1 Tax=Prorocentrum cordatum TaxID=2364126 RepID=A0ABN9SUQ8_9DINO|nr:unnamed protein product [Polarella glacialis]